MVNFGKISDAVQKLVANIAQTEGDKNRIDTQNEYDKLGEYLNGHADKLSTQDKDFIEGFMIEYQKEQLVEDITNSNQTERQKLRAEIKQELKRERKIHSKMNKINAEQTIEYKTKFGDSWTSIVREHYPEQINKYGEEAAIRALKKNLSVDENGKFDETLYKALLTGSDLPKTLKLPMFITFD